MLPETTKKKNETVLSDPAYGHAVIASGIVDAARTLGIAIIFAAICLCQGDKVYFATSGGALLIWLFMNSNSRKIKHKSEVDSEPKDACD